MEFSFCNLRELKIASPIFKSVFCIAAALVLFTLFVFGCESTMGSSSDQTVFPDSTTHYKVKAQIQPDSGQFNVTIDMRFVPDKPSDTLRFLLHDALKLEALTGSAVDGYATNPWHFGGEDTLHTKVVTVPLTRTATSSNPIAVSWKYDGQIQNEQIPGIGGAVITPHWIELPIETMWVTVHASIKRFTFEAQLDLPENYEVVSTGSLEKTSTGWYIQSNEPGPDVPLIISDQMQTQKYTSGAVPVTVYHSGAPDSLTSFVADRTGQILNHYAQHFQGGSETNSLRITLAPVERALPSSYARTGLIALRHEIEPDTTLFGLIAHEAAHLWWTDSVNPMSRHNFLNESFAEYESWLVLRQTYGDAIFQEQLEEARQNAKGAPSFSEWTPRLDGTLSYNKGPVLLHELHQRIGNADFQSFVRALQREDVGTIGEMIATLEEVTNFETAKWFWKKL